MFKYRVSFLTRELKIEIEFLANSEPGKGLGKWSRIELQNAAEHGL